MRGSAAFRTGVAPGGALAPGWVKNELWRKARAVPSLDLRFAENKSLVDATTGAQLVTFTRASSGTFVGSDGLLRSAVTNLLLRSEEFDNAGWAQAFLNEQVTANSVTAPNGLTVADTVATANATAEFGIGQSVTVVANIPITVSIFAKAAASNFVYLRYYGGITNGFYTIIVNLSTGVVTNTRTGSSTTAASHSLIAFANGWYRISCTATTNSANQFLIAGPCLTGTQVIGAIFGEITSAGTGNESVYLYGAQLEQAATAGEYIPTTSTINSAPRFDHNPTTGESLGLLVEEQRTNLQTFSEEFNNVAYGASAGSVSGVNAGIAPNGTSTADEITSTGGGIFRSLTVTTATVLTASVYAKYVSGGASFSFGCDSNPATARATFNLQTGVVTSNGANVTSSSITPAGNDWYRCTVTFTSTSTSIILVYYNATSGSRYLLWGAQLE